MNHDILLSEVRYAERLCQRTARLYRNTQATLVFCGVLGGSGVLSAVGGLMPLWVPMGGALLAAAAGAVGLAMRPADKAAVADADGKRYAQLRTQAQSMDAAQLQTALNKLHETDSAEIEALRDVAYNDAVLEIGQPGFVVPLTARQKLLSALA